jgi:hypothetical protein
MLPEGRTNSVTQLMFTQLLVKQFLFKIAINQGNSGKCFVLNLPDG